jgi:hypothetical protein
MKKLYGDDFDKIIDYINFDVIPILKYFCVYKRTNLKNHIFSLNSLDDYLSGIYKMRIFISHMKIDLNEFISNKNKEISAFIYHSLALRENGLFDDAYEIIENILRESKIKYHIQCLNYYSYEDECYFTNINNHCDFYYELVDEICQKVADINDFDYLCKWISEMSSHDYEDYRDLEKESTLRHNVIVDIIKKYNIVNQYQLFGYPYIHPTFYGIKFFTCISIVVYLN